MKKKSKVLSFILSICLTLSCFVPAFAAGVTQPSSGNSVAYISTESNASVIHISCLEDLITLSNNCGLDSWSVGKNVVLDCDISVLGSAFEPIASFGGTFDGCGHTISGFTINGGYSPAGLFATIQTCGTVKNIKVSGSVTLHGEKENAGGLCGINYGTIYGCSFSGNITADKYLGGIAAVNKASGLIMGCSSVGSMFGSSYTGGISGYNSGRIQDCTNYCGINTKSMDSGLSLDDINMDFSGVSDLLSSTDTESVEGRNSSSDTGGICGYSDGYIVSCRNEGEIGYSHVGYNVAGICGRSSGYIDGCTNNGTIYARKDAGGIVGQMEPFIEVSAKDDLIANLRNEMNILTSMIDKALDDSENTSGDINTRLTAVSDSANKAVDNLDNLSGQTTKFVDNNIDTVNDISDRVDYFLDEVPSMLTDLESAETYSMYAIRSLSAANEHLTMPESERKQMSDASADITTESAILSTSANQIRARANALEAIVADPGFSWVTDADQIVTILSEILSSLSDGVVAASRMADDFSVITRILTDYIANDVPAAQEDLGEALGYSDTAVAKLKSATTKLKNVITVLNGRDDISFSELGKKYTDEMDALYENIHATMDELEGLNESLGSNSKLIIGDLKDVNKQMNKVANLCVDLFLKAQDSEMSDVFEDVSDENMDKVILGKTKASSNTGHIYADINVGGIVGCVGIESELDPEADVNLSAGSVFNKVYRTKAVIEGCINRGSVSAKKDCAGCIAGAMELGIATGCQAYGRAESETGSNVGGIAGSSVSGIKDCFAKCTLKGTSYVGGILGHGSSSDNSSSVKNCYSLVNIEGCSQFGGAIAGSDLGYFSGNYFVSDTLRGLNRLSIKGQAEPMSYDELILVADIPSEFSRFTLSFLAEDQVIMSKDFNYGDSFDFSIYPEAPEKAGCYYEWDIKDLSNLSFDTQVNAIYHQYITAIESGPDREDGRPVFFAEGNFRKGENMTIEKAGSDIPEISALLNKPILFLSDGHVGFLRMYTAVSEAWNISYPDDGKDTHIIRYLPDGMDAKDCRIFVKSGVAFVPVKTNIIGSYLTFSIEGCEAEIVAVSAETVWWMVIVTGALLLSLIAIILLSIKKKNGAGKTIDS